MPLVLWRGLICLTPRIWHCWGLGCVVLVHRALKWGALLQQPELQMLNIECFAAALRKEIGPVMPLNAGAVLRVLTARAPQRQADKGKCAWPDWVDLWCPAPEGMTRISAVRGFLLVRVSAAGPGDTATPVSSGVRGSQEAV